MAAPAFPLATAFHNHFAASEASREPFFPDSRLLARTRSCIPGPVSRTRLELLLLASVRSEVLDDSGMTPPATVVPADCSAETVPLWTLGAGLDLPESIASFWGPALRCD